MNTHSTGATDRPEVSPGGGRGESFGPAVPTGSVGDSGGEASGRTKPRARPGRWMPVSLTIGSGLLAAPAGYAALYVVYMIIPLLLWVIGMRLLVGYLAASRGKRQSQFFWRASLVFNMLVGACWLSSSMSGSLVGLALFLWCAFAACISLVEARRVDTGAARRRAGPRLPTALHDAPVPALRRRGSERP